MDVTQEYIQKEEPDMLLQRAAEVAIITETKPKWYQFWRRAKIVKYTFSVHPLRLAQQQRIVARLSGLDESPFHNNENAISAYNKYISNNIDDVVYCAGVVLTKNARDEPSEWLIDLIKNNMDNDQLSKIWEIMLAQMYIKPFLNGIALIKGIEVNPRS